MSATKKVRKQPLRAQLEAAESLLATANQQIQELRGQLANTEPMPPDDRQSWQYVREHPRRTWQSKYEGERRENEQWQDLARRLQKGSRRLAKMLADRPDAASFAQWMADGMTEKQTPSCMSCQRPL